MDPPQSLKQNSSVYSIDLSWSKPVKGGGAKQVAEYFVEWSPADNNGNQSKAIPENFTTLDNLSPNSQYNISLAARTERGNNSTNGALFSFEGITCT